MSASNETQPEQHTHRRRRRGHGSADHSEEMMGELNLVPYLDVVINIMLFLLLTTSAGTNFGLLSFNVPTYSNGGGAAGEKPEKEPLKLVVRVAEEGFQLQSNYGSLDPIPRNGPPKVDLGYNFTALHDALVKVGEQHPRDKNATLSVAGTVPYGIVVKALETMRQPKEGQCKVDRALPKEVAKKRKTVPEYIDNGPTACIVSDKGDEMICRSKEDEAVVYSNCLFPDVILSEKVF
jgi:biopolymer transport protein TolR